MRLRPKQPAELDASARPVPQVRNGRIRQVLHQGLRIAREQAARKRSEPYEIEVAAVDLDGVTVVGVPGELFLELGEAIRARTVDRAGVVVVFGYTNGYLGYLPARDTPPCYETFASPVSPGSGEIVVETAVEVAIEAARDRDRSRRNRA